MLSIALATVRTRWVSFVGAFIALALGTGMIAMMALALTATLGTPHEGPQRFAKAQTVVVPADPRGDPMELPAALPDTAAAKAAAAGAVVEDRTFDAPWRGGPSDAVGHGWSSAVLKNQAVRVAPVPVYYDTLKAKLKEDTRTAATVILGISVGYSLISVANTLVMAAAGRRRELASLNLAGATRGQILRVIAAEALLATVIGTILAAVAGAAVVLTQRLSLTKLVDGAATVLPWGSTWQVVVLCAVTAVTAAVLSARHTIRGRAVELAGTRD
ncbi:FtsX-like permease family protein [Kitasatospora cineracea]